MAYEFKDLATVDLIDTSSKEMNVIVEENGAIKKISSTKFSSASNEVPSTNLPENILVYDSQELIEEQQMQARKNLGLYHSYEEDIIEKVFKYAYVGWWEVEEDNLSSIVDSNQSYIVQFLDNEYKVETKSKDTTIPNVGAVDVLLWIGNPSLINTDNIKYDLSDEQDYRDLPFVIYWYADEYAFEGINPTIAVDSSITPNMGQGLIVYCSVSTKVVHQKIPEEYMPDTIKTVVTYTEQELTNEQQMQVRKNLGLYGKSEKPLSLINSVEALSSVSTEIVNFSPENIINVRITQMDMLLTEYTFEQNEQYDYGSDITYRWYGNGYLMNNSFTDTGDGIVIYQKNGSNWTLYIHHSRIENGVPHTQFYVDIIDPNQTEIVYEKIPKEYLPDNIGVTSWNELEDKPFGKEVFDSFDCVYEYGHPDNISTVDGTLLYYLGEFYASEGNYVLTDANGNTYNSYFRELNTPYALKCEVNVSGDDIVVYSVLKNGTFDNINFPLGGIYASAPNYRYDVYITKIEACVVTPLGEEFIPETIARVKDMPEGFSGSWNDLTDKPFSESVVSIDIVPEQTITFTDGVASLTGVKDPCYSLNLCSDPGSFEAILEINGETIEGTVNYYFVATGTFGSYDLDLGSEAISLLEGASIGNGETVTVHLYVNKEAVSPLDEKYIPMSVPRMQIESGDNLFDTMDETIPIATVKNGNKVVYERVKIFDEVDKRRFSCDLGKWAQFQLVNNVDNYKTAYVDGLNACWLKIIGGNDNNAYDKGNLIIRINDEVLWQSGDSKIPNSRWCCTVEQIMYGMCVLKIYSTGGIIEQVINSSSIGSNFNTVRISLVNEDLSGKYELYYI